MEGGRGRGRRGWKEGEEEEEEEEKGGGGEEQGEEVINFGSKGRQILLLTVFSGGNQLQQRCFR